jgi:hypothetical protein
MKKLIFCLTMAAFAVVSSAQAGEKVEKTKAASADTAKATGTVEAKTACATEKTACCASSSKKLTAKQTHSMKGAQLLALR